MSIALLTSPKVDSPLRKELDFWREHAKAPLLRDMGDWAEAEVALPPDGPFPGRRYRMSRQPWTRLWFQHVGLADDVYNCFEKFVLTGPSQSGKSLHGHIIPGLYHLFEVGESVALGLPDMTMTNDKWMDDFLPIIEHSRYREWLPRRGAGSRQGRVKDAVYFGNGTSLRFFTGGGGDKSRAGKSVRVMIITEVDGLDVVGGTSKESDKVAQLEARTNAHATSGKRRIYLECTASTESGRITVERKRGTDSRIVCPCPHCGEWVTPERDDLTGWQTAETEHQAGQQAAFACPACKQPYDEAQRGRMNAASRLLHRGQEMSGGEIVGDLPGTDTFSMRYSAFNNTFMPAAVVAKKEWAKVHGPADKEEERERELRQFFWCIPVEPSATDVVALEVEHILQRTTQEPRGVVPAGAPQFCVFCDMGKWQAHWVALAIRENGSPHVVDYGMLEVPTREVGEERAILLACRRLRDEFCQSGWAVGQADSAQRRVPDAVGVDARYQGERADVYPVYDFMAESAGIQTAAGQPRYWPALGFSASEYSVPKGLNNNVAKLGERYHVARLVRNGKRIRCIEQDADHWKAWVHNRLITPLGSPGAMTLFAAAEPFAHLAFAQHLTAEKQTEEFVPGKGLVVKFERLRRANHKLDATAGACLLAHLAGARLVQGDTPPRRPPPPPRPRFTMPDGRPYLLSER